MEISQLTTPAGLGHKQFGRGSISPGHRRHFATGSNIGSIRILCIIGIVNSAWFNT
jgi:hypothetical protein